jgi:hypothetical protein
MEKGQGNSWEESLLALLRGGPLVQSGVTEN